jgi:hypothetical protein
MKDITEENLKQISKFLLQTADYWINRIGSFTIQSPIWTDFKKNMDPFLHYPSILKTAPDSSHPNIHIGLINYHEIGEHIIFGPRIDKFFDSYVLTIKINDRELWKIYAEKTDEIQKLIHEKQREEVERDFLQAVSAYPGVDSVTRNLHHLSSNFPKKEWMIKLYKTSWEHLIHSSVENFSPAMYCAIQEDNPTIPCIGSDQYIQLLHEPNSPGYYTLRFGSFISGQDFMTVSLGKDDSLKKHTDECEKVFSTHLQETMQDTLFTILM